MTLRVELCPYGDPALARLRHLIDQAKGADPFRPVNVVVARGSVGLNVRRELAAGMSGDGRRGVANVTFVTLDGLADTVAARTLAADGRGPLTDAVLRGAISGALAVVGGPELGPARDHSSTIDALVTTYRELRAADEAVLDRLAALSARSHAVASILRHVRKATEKWFDTVDVLRAATLRALQPPAVVDGAIVLYLPTALTQPGAEFVRALAAHATCTALIGVTGDDDPDGVARHLIGVLRPDHQVAWPAVAPVGIDGVLSAPTADAEILLVARELMGRFDAGTPLERMAIVHAGSSQYVTLIHGVLAQAGIPFNGGGVRPLSATVAGRILLGVLSLPDRDWRREDVVRWLHTGPMVHRGRRIPSTRWDVLSAESGINEGFEAWHRQLNAFAEARRADATRADAEGEEGGGARRIQLADAEHCAELLDFLDGIAAELSDSPSEWASWVRWASALFHRLVGGSAAIEDWPTEDRAAAQAVEAAIERLADLDQLHKACTPSAARAALESELAVPAPQVSRFGTGVFVGSLAAAVGLNVDVLFVVGMNDGTFPARPSDDVLVPDRQRQDAQGDGTLPLRGERAVAMRRDYLAALAGSRSRMLSYPRGNQRDGRALRPSRWALDALGELVVPARRLYAKDVETLESTDGFRLEPSYVTSVAAPGQAMSLEDRDLRSLWEWTTSGQPVLDHYLAREDNVLAKGAELIDGRRRGFTRFNGDIGQSGRLGAFLPPVLSATRLETYAACPRRYFFEWVLHVEPRPESERLEATDRMHYGSLVHRILEGFVGPQIGRTPGEGPDDPFSVDRLLAVAEDELAAFEAEGRTGPRTAWKAERVQLLRELRRFADLDRTARVKDAVVTTGVEVGFGFGNAPPVVIDVNGRQPVQFRGVIDRVDRERGGARAVTDYKTGSARRYKGVEADHFGEGSTVQLPVYALAAGASEQSPVRADYWCVTEKGEFKRFGFEVGTQELDQLAEVVDTLTDALDSAQFPANPGAPHRAREGQCTYCPYDSVCPRDRLAAWDVVKRDPRLSRLTALVEPS